MHRSTVSCGVYDLRIFGPVNYYGYNTPYPCRLSGGQILEALHSDPASSLSVEQERTAKLLKPPPRFVMMITMLWRERLYVHPSCLRLISCVCLEPFIFHGHDMPSQLEHISVSVTGKSSCIFHHYWHVISVNSTSSALAKLSKGASGGTGKTPQTEKKETPQERLKRIMSKQLNKQSMC